MKLLACSLSLRINSYNTKLIQIVKTIVEANNVNLETLDLNKYELPSYNQDLEDVHGIPESAKQLQQKISLADGLILSSPEYNYSYPGFFKNTFDWISRFRPNPWHGKYILLLSASPALAGGERALWPLRVPFEGNGAIVYPNMFTLPLVGQAFNQQHELIDPKIMEKLSNLVVAFIKFSQKLST